MSDPVKDVVPLILMKIQADISAFRESVETRLDRLEDISRKQRRDTAGLLVMANAVSGDFAEELAAVQERISALEGERHI